MAPENELLQAGFQAYGEVAQDLAGWALMMIAGSIAAIVSTSYVKPTKRWIRLAYLLFLPGWACLGGCLYYAAKIKRRYLAALFVDDEEILLEIGTRINQEFALQLQLVGWGLGFFTLWLLLFLTWWIFYRQDDAEQK